MAINKIDFPTASTPSYTPDIETDYNNQNEYIERHARGKRGVTLTNWGNNDSAPSIAAGSFIESNGSIYDVTSGESIDTTGVSAGIVYVIFDDSTLEFKLTNTAPTWSATLNGWYVGTDKATGHRMYWDGSTGYADKVFIADGMSAIDYLDGPAGAYAGGLNLTYSAYQRSSDINTTLTGDSRDGYVDDSGPTLNYAQERSGTDGTLAGASMPFTGSVGFTGGYNTGLWGVVEIGGTTYLSDDTGNDILQAGGGGGTVLFSTPSTSPRGITTDGTNLISCDAGNDTFYLHSGITSTITRSFTIASISGPRGLHYRDGVLWTTDGTKIHAIDFENEEILGSFTGARSNLNGVAFDGSLLMAWDNGGVVDVYGVGPTRAI